MIETLSGISAGSPTELMTMNSPSRSTLASTEIFTGGSIGTSPSPCHSPISGWNSFILGLLFRAAWRPPHETILATLGNGNSWLPRAPRAPARSRWPCDSPGDQDDLVGHREGPAPITFDAGPAFRPRLVV